MVEFEEVDDKSSNNEEPLKQEESPSETRQLDAEYLEGLLESITRESAKLHLTNLVSKLKKEASALRRVEASKAKVAEENAVTDAVSSAGDGDKEGVPKVVEKPAPQPVKMVDKKPPVLAASNKYVPIDSFAFDAGGYNSKFVTLYISLPGVGSLDRKNITCKFDKESFDLIVNDYKGKAMRLMRDNLEKDIDPDASKIIVKAEKIVVKLAKVKGEYGSYDSWTELTDKKGKKKKALDAKKDPSASIMDLMKDMYDSGDDQMKKMIGETMLKQREGKLDKGPGGMPGLDSDI